MKNIIRIAFTLATWGIAVVVINAIVAAITGR
jgi:hypothetical protein